MQTEKNRLCLEHFKGTGNKILHLNKQISPGEVFEALQLDRLSWVWARAGA
jgi:transcription termination factor Rho